MQATKNIITQIEKFISFLKSLDENDFSALESGEQKIIFSFGTKTSSSKIKKSELSEIEIKSIYETLNSLDSREKGLEMIEHLNRFVLEKLCRMAELSFTKKDQSQKLKSKIIEGTIGFRLNSKAIQQIN